MNQTLDEEYCSETIIKSEKGIFIRAICDEFIKTFSVFTDFIEVNFGNLQSEMGSPVILDDCAHLIVITSDSSEDGVRRILRSVKMKYEIRF